MKKFFLGIIVGVCGLLLAAYLFILSGGMPVAVKDRELPLEHYLAKKALRKAYSVDLEKQAPFEFTADHIVNAQRIYKNNCGGCHGVGDHPNRMAAAMFPPAPQFFHEGDDVKHDALGKIYWKIKNGIRLTGMPGYSDILSEQEIWEVTLFLKTGEKVKD